MQTINLAKEGMEGQGHFWKNPGRLISMKPRPRYQVSVYRTNGPLVVYVKTKPQTTAQRLCFRFMDPIDSTIPLLPKSEISSLYPSSVIAQPCLCHTWSKNPKNEAQLIHHNLLSNIMSESQ